MNLVEQRCNWLMRLPLTLSRSITTTDVIMGKGVSMHMRIPM